LLSHAAAAAWPARTTARAQIREELAKVYRSSASEAEVMKIEGDPFYERYMAYSMLMKLLDRLGIKEPARLHSHPTWMKFVNKFMKR
jgi:hypothetical protein